MESGTVPPFSWQFGVCRPTGAGLSRSRACCIHPAIRVLFGSFFFYAADSDDLIESSSRKQKNGDNGKLDWSSYSIQIESAAGCCWIAEWCGVAADRTKRRALAPNPRSNAVDASSSSSAVWSGHGRTALQRRSRQSNNNRCHNDSSPYSLRDGGTSSSSCSDSSFPQHCAAIIRPHPALPKRLQNVLDEKRLNTSLKRPADSKFIAGRTAMSDNFIYGDITR